MDQLLQAFGIDVKLIIIQIINFTVLASILTYLLYKPVLKMLAEREAKIKQGIADAEAAAQARAMAVEEKQNILEHAEHEAEAIDAKAKAHAKEQEKTIVAEAQTKAAEVVAQAQAKSALLKKQALQESEAEIARLAILASEKILKEHAS